MERQLWGLFLGTPSRHRMAWLAGCALASAAMGLSTISPASAGCNSGNDAQTNLLSSGNCQASASDSGSTAVGLGATASGNDSTALGRNSLAMGSNATVLGHDAGPSEAVAGVTAVGASSGYNGAGIYSTAIGGGTLITASTASTASGAYSVAIGGGDGASFTPTGLPAIKLNGALASGFISTAVGAAAQAIGGGSSAFGLGSKATGANSAAYGEFSAASGASSVAVGLFSRAIGVSSLALGRNAAALQSGSVALGENSIANVANTISVGRAGRERRIMNVAAGSRPTDAVNLAQLQAAVAAIAELRTLVRQQQQRISELESRAASLPPR